MRLLLLTLLALGAVRADDEEKKEDVGTVVGIDLGTTYSWYGGAAGLAGSARAPSGETGPVGPRGAQGSGRRAREGAGRGRRGCGGDVEAEAPLTVPLPPNPSVGVFKNGRVEIIANDQGNRITPSYVAFTPEGERLIGDAAKNQLTSNPENTVFDAKRLIGRTWNDPSVQQDIKYLPFKVGPGCRRGGAGGEDPQFWSVKASAHSAPTGGVVCKQLLVLAALRLCLS